MYKWIMLLVLVLGISFSQVDTSLAQAEKREGFYTEGWNTYYYDSNGNKVTGWQQINRNGINCWHYFSETGVMTIGFIKIDDKWYYFKEDGTLTHSGLEVIDGGVYSFNSDGYADLGWQNIDGDWYYFARDNGQAYTGAVNRIEGDGYRYFFWHDDFEKKDGSHGKEGTLAVGNPYLGIYQNGVLSYVADQNGHLLINQEITMDGKEYILDSKGMAAEKRTEEVFRQKVREIEMMFPVNAYWKNNGINNPQSYNYDGSGDGNRFDNAWQCNGFAKYLYYYVYGQTSIDIYDPQENIPTSVVRVGDYLRIGNNEHSIFITDIYTGSDGRTHWKVAREVWGSSNNIIKECDYTVISNTEIKYGNRTYIIDAIRRANNELRKNVGLPDAEILN